MTERNFEAKTLKVLDAWRKEPLDAALLGVHDQQQLQQVARALRGVAEARRRQRRWRRIAGALAVAAAAGALGLGGWVLRRGPEQPVASPVTAPSGVVLAAAEGELQVFDARGQPVAQGALLGADASVETRAGAATLAFPSGASARAGAGTRIVVQATGVERREALALARGRVEVEVPKLAQPVEFSIQTPEARVVVHGTHFAVEVDPDAAPGSRTHVVVSRGLVAVLVGDEQNWVRAGEEWPPVPEPPVPDPAGARAGEPDAAIAPSAGGRERGPVQHSTGAAQHARRSQLAAENRQFAAAMAKYKEGDLSGALLEIDRLIEQHPDSLLMQEARVERFRLLLRLKRHAEAVRAARSYLGDYHDGYAREEARSIALENP